MIQASGGPSNVPTLFKRKKSQLFRFATLPFSRLNCIVRTTTPSSHFPIKYGFTIALPQHDLGDFCPSYQGKVCNMRDIHEVQDWCICCINVLATFGTHDHTCEHDFTDSNKKAHKCVDCNRKNTAGKNCIPVSQHLKHYLPRMCKRNGALTLNTDILWAPGYIEW